MEEREGEGEGEGGSSSSSYRYWVRDRKDDALPMPEPRKLTGGEENRKSGSALGSVWNQAGTWEERSVNKWASPRLKELILSVDPLRFSSGNARISDVTKCEGDAVVVTVRKKKRVGYSYRVSLGVKGEWLIGDRSEPTAVEAELHIPDVSLGEVDELQLEVEVNANEKVKDGVDKARICNDLKLFLEPLQHKLLQFEHDLNALTL